MVPYEKVTIPPDKIRRTIGKIRGKKNNKNVVFFAGIHGNEPAGVIALERVLNFIEQEKLPFNGNMWALQGNLPALQQNKRYLEKDLNRIWYTRYNDAGPDPDEIPEFSQREELKDYIWEILNSTEGEVYFFDLHTTSSQSIPFVSISDTLRNREVIEDIPVAIVLGLEEKMEGTMFSFFSELGISTILFEAGQHESIASVDNHEAFIWMMLSKLGFVSKDHIPEFHLYLETLARESVFGKRIFQLKYSYQLNGNISFKMNSGFVNFQPVKQDQELAEDHQGIIRSPMYGRIFMPLYQNQGNEGFFIIEEIRKLWLRISERFRKLGLDRYMHLIPGVRKDKTFPECFLVNNFIASSFILDFFHLLGYRKVVRHDRKFIVKRRPFDRKHPGIDVVRKRFRDVSLNGSSDPNN